MDKDVPTSYVSDMKELLRTNDPTVIAFASALLDSEGITFFEFDVNMSVLEGSIGIMPRRLMVADRDLFMAEAVMRDAEIDLGR
ncbi:Putative signal transducing protein [Cognatiyoonia koreensis]|uniref:Putative signal transducing protein n=2 Tax=Cognatiyoonia koreensis TaxID=364200 RepID=A0A1I0RFZ3_9RHOB|nr:Putative signal transducing protein [Cognatiyoonia koreensis]